MQQHELDPIFLAAPTSNHARLVRITAAASGFIYYVSLKGVTGAANLAVDSVAGKLDELRELTDLPLGVGFGIKDAEMAGNMARIADAVVVGSALVSRIEENVNEPDKIIREMRDLMGSMRAAMDSSGN